MAQKKPSFVTPQEYLVLERDSEVKHEYLDGEIFEMAGTNRRHNQICANLIHFLVGQVRDRDCSVYGSDMRIRIPDANYTYPDVVAVCGGEQFEDDSEDNLLNPLVIVEVLSKSTEAYDRGAKFEQYQTVPSLREYVLVTQEPYRVEHFVRQEVSTWTYFEFRKPEDTVNLSSIGCELRLEDIYEKVKETFPKDVEV